MYCFNTRQGDIFGPFRDSFVRATVCRKLASADMVFDWLILKVGKSSFVFPKVCEEHLFTQSEFSTVIREEIPQSNFIERKSMN